MRFDYLCALWLIHLLLLLLCGPQSPTGGDKQRWATLTGSCFDFPPPAWLAVIPKKTSIQLWFLLLSVLQVTPDLRAEQKTRLSFVCGPEWTFIRAAFRLREDQANKVFLPLPDCVIPLTFLCALKCEDLVCVCVCALITVWYVGVNQRDRYLWVLRAEGGAGLTKTGGVSGILSLHQMRAVKSRLSRLCCRSGSITRLLFPPGQTRIGRISLFEAP